MMQTKDDIIPDTVTLGTNDVTEKEQYVYDIQLVIADLDDLKDDLLLNNNSLTIVAFSFGSRYDHMSHRLKSVLSYLQNDRSTQ